MRKHIEKLKIIHYIFILILIPCYILSAPTGTPEEAIEEIERRQYEIEKKLREKERLEIEREKKEIKKEDIPISDDNKFFIKEIILENDELLSGSEKRKLLKPYTNKELTYNDLTVLVGNITNLLIEKGYVTARVKIPLEQNIGSGIFVITIINGYISEIVPEKDGFTKRIGIFTAFPFLSGKYLNIGDLDYGIEQMNKLRSNNASMKIHPGEEMGSSKVVIYNDRERWFFIETGFDNLGQKNTGETRGKLTVGFDDLLCINDFISFDYTHSLSDRDIKYNRTYTMNLMFPFGYWSFLMTYSRSEYMQHIEGLNTEFQTSGDDINKVFGIDRMLFKYKDNRFKARSSLTLKTKENFLEDAKIDSAGRKLTVFKFGMDYSTFLLDGYFSSNIYYSRGLKLLGAYKDDNDLEDDIPRAQFNKYEIGFVWNKPFMLFEQSFSYMFNFFGQWGLETLYSSEKISIGDMNTVRGFKQDSLLGDRGFYIRNEFSSFDFSYLWKYLKGLRLFVGYDYAYAVERVGRDANYGRGEGSVMSWCTGLNYSTEVIDLNVTYSRHLFAPWFMIEKDYIVYVTATLSCTGLFDEIMNFF
ncbi:MAG: ShlB/FhaC/HecB family hemolysin secretion/activation protein [Leptospirales bacterium]|nr:ShlB/FhaC/HecB family hemolysin secretion/activation protein [Leptospirales bacterium]